MLLHMHALITLAAGVVLVVIPKAIPHTVDMPPDKKQQGCCFSCFRKVF